MLISIYFEIIKFVNSLQGLYLVPLIMKKLTFFDINQSLTAFIQSDFNITLFYFN